MHATNTNTTGTEKASVNRYSRQLILNEVGPTGQDALSSARVLIVGAGGLASTAGPYLAAAGIGHLTFIDDDSVDVSNLHRQVMHSTAKQGVSKVESAKEACLAINPSISVEAIHARFTAENGVEVVQRHDVVVDATDNITARYLVNDACVLSSRPLVSGSALRWEGQLSVYHHEGGPCYRCAYPTPPPLQTVTSCADGGVIGAVPGAIGCLQATEVQKILLKTGKTMSGRILLYNALEMTHTTMNQRPRNVRCAVCGDTPTITTLKGYDEYIKRACDADAAGLPDDVELSCEEYLVWQREERPHLLIDVRVPAEYKICRLENAVNMPLSAMSVDEVIALRLNGGDKGGGADGEVGDALPVVMLCRRGIASANAAKLLLDAGVPNVRNITSGLTRWAAVIDKDFPIY